MSKPNSYRARARGECHWLPPESVSVAPAFGAR